MDQIETKLLSISNNMLVKKFEDEWSTLETLHQDLSSKIDNQKQDIKNLQQILNQAEHLCTKPVEMRKESNFEIRQLLFRVRFG